jgi:hypothetical protein
MPGRLHRALLQNLFHFSRDDPRCAETKSFEQAGITAAA